VIPPNPLPGGGLPPPGPTPSTAGGAKGAGGRAGRASRAQPPPYANPGYATDVLLGLYVHNVSSQAADGQLKLIYRRRTTHKAN
jgi:hypothetical protein